MNPPPSSPSGSAPSPLILVVDDDPDFLDLTRHVLEAAGYRVACASDPAAASAAIARETPNLIVTDLMMAALDSGFSLARRIKGDEHLRGVPVIMATAIATRLGYDFAPRTQADLAAMHADGFLEKPVLPGRLLAEIEKLLGRERQGGAP